ncbi:MAG: DEAD/DEAH box helicase, partial [Desulfobacterales bacterium]|nr:DEAD/DEAH box helicase [Desulfobacterales bacterium]
MGIDDYIKGLKSFKGFAGDIVSHKTFDAQPAAWASGNTFPSFKNDLSRLLAGLGIKNLYTHQARAVSLILDNCHTVIATPTASGKSLVYNLPVMDELISDPQAHALYLFPLKALARDQLDTVNQMLAGTDAVFSQPLTAGVYDGDITAYQKTKIRKNPPNILLSNPEMLHLA